MRASASHPVDVNAAGTRWLTYLIFAVGVVSYYLYPIWAGMFIEVYGFSNEQTGLLLSADMTTNTIASMSARYWIHRCYWRKVFPFAVALTFFPNLLCAAAEGFWTFLSLRYLAGLGAGAMVAFMYATVSASENPDREFACAMSLQVVTGALCLHGSSYLWAAWGAGSVFVLCGMVTLLPLLCLRALPAGNPLSNSPGSIARTPEKTARAILPGLVGVAVFFASMNAVWSFMERIGNAEGFAADFIAFALTISLFFSFAGALLPAWIAGRARRITLISTGYAILFIAIFLLGRPPAALIYLAALCLYNFFYSFVIPFQSGWVASLDQTGRTTVLLPVFQGIGLASGPALAGFVIVGDRYDSAVHLSIALLVVSLLLFTLMHSWLKKSGRVMQSTAG